MLIGAVEKLLAENQGCEGTAFFAVQSCMNHSCAPNASTSKGDDSVDGIAVVTALQDIEAEEEIFISYIDEDMPLEERQHALRDYGFDCCCRRCCSEQICDLKRKRETLT